MTKFPIKKTQHMLFGCLKILFICIFLAIYITHYLNICSIFFMRKTPNSPFVKELSERSGIWRSNIGLWIRDCFYMKDFSEGECKLGGWGGVFYVKNRACVK